MRCACVEEMQLNLLLLKGHVKIVLVVVLNIQQRHFLKFNINLKVSESKAMACKSTDVCSS